MRGKIQRYQIENVLKNKFIVFLRDKKQEWASLIVLPRMGSISDCNVCERRVVKQLKTWRD